MGSEGCSLGEHPQGLPQPPRPLSLLLVFPLCCLILNKGFVQHSLTPSFLQGKKVLLLCFLSPAAKYSAHFWSAPSFSSEPHTSGAIAQSTQQTEWRSRQLWALGTDQQRYIVFLCTEISLLVGCCFSFVPWVRQVPSLQQLPCLTCSQAFSTQAFSVLELAGQWVCVVFSTVDGRLAPPQHKGTFLALVERRHQFPLQTPWICTC